MQSVTRVGLTVYKALLGLYPRAFRRAFVFDMIQDFEDASQEAWQDGRWKGVLSLWLFTGGDVLRTLPIQWVRSGTLIFSGLALMSAASCAAAVGALDPRVPYVLRPSTPERDGVLLLILVTTTVVVIAATVIFSLMFLRPVLNRSAGRRRV
jgi:hypothetical protein